VAVVMKADEVSVMDVPSNAATPVNKFNEVSDMGFVMATELRVSDALLNAPVLMVTTKELSEFLVFPIYVAISVKPSEGTTTLNKSVIEMLAIPLVLVWSNLARFESDAFLIAPS